MGVARHPVSYMSGGPGDSCHVAPDRHMQRPRTPIVYAGDAAYPTHDTGQPKDTYRPTNSPSLPLPPPLPRLCSASEHTCWALIQASRCIWASWSKWNGDPAPNTPRVADTKSAKELASVRRLAGSGASVVVHGLALGVSEDLVGGAVPFRASGKTNGSSRHGNGSSSNSSIEENAVLKVAGKCMTLPIVV